MPSHDNLRPPPQWDEAGACETAQMLNVPPISPRRHAYRTAPVNGSLPPRNVKKSLIIKIRPEQRNVAPKNETILLQYIFFYKIVKFTNKALVKSVHEWNHCLGTRYWILIKREQRTALSLLLEFTEFEDISYVPALIRTPCISNKFNMYHNKWSKIISFWIWCCKCCCYCGLSLYYVVDDVED